MGLRILRDSALESLRSSVEKNLELYRKGDFGFIDLDSSQWYEMPWTTDDKALSELKPPDPKADEFYEVENCKAVSRYLPTLAPYEARDERLWSYLSHTIFLDYARARWPVPDDDEEAVRHIKTHFFAATNRQIERDNAVARLWWMAHLCERVSGVPLEEALSAFLFRTDVRANIIERPTVAQCRNVFTVVVRKLIASFNGKRALFERRPFRQFMVELNSVGGFRLLDCLPEAEIETIVDGIVSKNLKIAAL